nr:AIR carboxylase family protein [uncultured Sphaerochaeta sp.]
MPCLLQRQEKLLTLQGFLASRSLLPVIGIPLSASLDGMDALLSTVQMPHWLPCGNSCH